MFYLSYKYTSIIKKNKDYSRETRTKALKNTPWCGPCKKLSPVVDKIAEENPHIKVGKVNVEEQRELAEKFHIMSIPALVLMKEGKAVASSVGVKPQAAIEKMLNS